MKNFIHILLLFVFSFSISHGIVLDIDQEKHCSMQHDVGEEHEGDFCATHCLLHISFLVPTAFALPKLDALVLITPRELFCDGFASLKSHFRPPIA
jgi:hypothetical protein